MEIQSLSVVVPTKGCINHCPFCVSRMHNSPSTNSFSSREYEKRLKYASLNKVTNLIITGTGEPLQNIKFLQGFKNLLEKMGHPFPSIEFQTTGIMLNEAERVLHVDEALKPVQHYKYLDFLRELGVTTISLSVSNIFDDQRNLSIIGVPPKLSFSLVNLIKIIKDYGFNVRLSLNMVDDYIGYDPESIISRCKEIGADQVTFRVLYGEGDSSQAKWVEKHSAPKQLITAIENYIAGKRIRIGKSSYRRIHGKGTPLYSLPYGPTLYSVMGMSIAIDEDCMSKEENKEVLRYLILRENGKLYSRWDDMGSLIF